MAITNGYATLAQIKSSLRITDNVDDELLELAIETASRQIDGVCERHFYSESATRVFSPRDAFVTEVDDIVSLTSLKTSTGADGVFDVTWTSTDYQLEPLNGVVSGGPTATVQVEGTFGFSSVPTAIKQATVILGSRIFKRNDAPLGVTGFGDLGVIRVGRVDPDVEAMVSPWKRMRFA